MGIKKFKDFNKSKVKEEDHTGIEFKREREESDLSSDIESLDKVLDKEIIKISDTEDLEIVSINDISLDEPTDVELKESIIINADFSGEKVKRGDVFWVTAMVKKGNSTLNSMAVFKCRITDIYQGLSILKTIK